MFKHLINFAALALAAWLPTGMAQASTKHPLEYPLRDYGMLLAVALLGGLVSWYAKVRKGTAQAWNVMQLIGELTTSAFAGLLTFWLLEWAGAPLLLTVCLVGVAGHMGAKAIELLEGLGRKRLARAMGVTEPADLDGPGNGGRP